MTDLALDREALALFEACLEADPADVEGWLAARTLDRADLAARVRTLIAAETGATFQTGGAATAIDIGEESPQRLGGYLVIERIGSGGMGTVYLAKRDRGDFEHVAAIKVIRPGLLSQRLVDRFRRERQILAQLRHPNIAQLFDGGETEDGSPFMIMELVEGQPLPDWAEETGASRAERIEKLLQACAAVSFAHASLIVHRDITPSNVLVTKAGVVKLIDFGIARPAGALDEAPPPSGGVSTLRTLSLTPGYAAPERAMGAEPTTAADVYSLGKLVQKVLPPDDADRELAAIITRATARLPEDRYRTVDALASDLAAWRDNRPVDAVGGGGGYVFGKFLGRHRTATWLGAAALVALVGAFAGTTVAWLRADQARAAETQRFGEVRELANYLIFDLNEQLRSVPGNTAARADLAAKAQAYLDALAVSPGADRALELETARGLIRLAEIQDSPLERNLGETAAAQANFARARDMLTAMRESFGDAPDLDVTEARLEAMASLISFYEDSNSTRAEEQHARGEAALERVPPDLRDQEWRRAQRDLSLSKMERLSTDERFDDLIAAADAHDAMIDAWPEEEKAGDEAEIEHAFARYNRGVALSLTDHEAEAYPLMRDAHDVFAAAEARAPGNPRLLFWIGWSGADAYAAAARLNKEIEAEGVLVSAQKAARRLVAIEDRDESARILDVMLGETYAQHLGNTDRFDEAIAEQQRIVDAKIAAMTEDSAGWDAGWSEMILGIIARQAERRELACKSFASAEARFTGAEASGDLIPFHASFLPGLRDRVKRCADGTPMSEFGPLR